jgi:GntR family transcriptional regulator, transcriptional repressor for pyruvate dehydrogenase complex
VARTVRPPSSPVADVDSHDPWVLPSIPTRARPLKRSELIAREIVEDLLRRGLTPGHVLEPEQAMLQRYQVGRATLREALRLLEAQGLVVIKPGPGGGPVLAPVDASTLGRGSTMYFRLAGATYRELSEAMINIQPWLAELAASRKDHKKAAIILATNVDQTDAMRSDAEGIWRTAPQFHALVNELSGNRVLSIFANALGSIFTNQLMATVNLTPKQGDFLAAHHELADAIAKGDAIAARESAREHMQDIHDFCEKHAGYRLDQVIEWD